MSQSATVTAIRPNHTPVTHLTTSELVELLATRGLCADRVNDERFFPNRTITPDEAAAACAGCPVINECLELALRSHSDYGVFGGTTPEQRAEMLAEAVA